MAIFKEINADKTLWSLIFGESILNDAISIVSYKYIPPLNNSSHFDSTVVGIATETSGGWNPILRFSLIFFGSMGIGIAIGVMCAYVKYLFLAIF